MYLRAFLFFLITSSVQLFSIESTELIKPLEVLPLAKHVTVFIDESNQASLEDLMKDDNLLKQPKDDNLSFGYSENTHWFAFEFFNDTSEDLSRYLEVAYPPLDTIILYQTLNKKVVFTETLGDDISMLARSIKHHSHVFLMKFLPKQKYKIYLKVKTTSSIRVPLTLYSVKSFHEKDHIEQYILGLYYGVMIAMILYNLLIFLTIKEINYLWYVLYISTFTMFVLVLNGVASERFWPDSPSWWSNLSLNVFGLAFLAFFINFARAFLNFKNYAPLLNHVLLYLTGFYALMIPLCFVLPLRFLNQYNSVLAFLNALMVVGMAIFAIMKGFRPARLFLLAFGVLLFFGIIWTLSRGGLFGNSFIAEYGMQIGSVIEVIVLAIALGKTLNTLKTEKEKTELESLKNRLLLLESFSRFVPKQFLKSLGKSSVEEVNEGEANAQEMVVMFCDIRKFTSLSESMTPDENFRFLNSYLKRMAPIILNNNGFIDKFIGDAIMALFAKADDALRASIAMYKELIHYNKLRNRQNYAPIDIGIGLNAGQVILGTVGSKERLDTTVIGNAVNLASRIESLNKIYGTRLILSESVREGLHSKDKFRLRLIDNIMVRGKESSTKIYECYDIDSDDHKRDKEKLLVEYEEALEYYTKGSFETALAKFNALAKNDSSDLIYTMYVKRCKKLQERQPKAWRGVSRMR